MEKLPRTQYSPEFRQQSIQFFKESGLTLVEAAKRLSLPKGTLKNWVYADNQGELASLGKHQKPLTELDHYTYDYQNLLKQFGMIASMSRKGDCWDNAPMESFWGILKNELMHHRKFKTRQQAIQEITEYIAIFYNRQRKQKRLGYLSPAAFTQRYYEISTRCLTRWTPYLTTHIT